MIRRCLAVPIRAASSCGGSGINISPLPVHTGFKTAPVAAAVHCRPFGTRGARGHGWYVKYRSGRGGRHLQGEYHDRETPDQAAAWNEAIFQLGMTRVYMDICLEPRRTSNVGTALMAKFYPVPPVDKLTGEKFRLTIDLASTVLPETTNNFLHLLCGTGGTSHGYVGTRLFRVEKKVGVKGGDVLTNTGKTGKAAAHYGQPLQMEITNDPLCLWHIPGIISMLVPSVGTIDSRFLLVSEPAPHIDGICRAFGRLTPDSLAVVDKWQNTLITNKGIPTAYDLIICAGGKVDATSIETNTSNAAAVAA
jgi:cyclophilin family peptidyl-prolyl cis-trans isomerase